MASPRDKQHAGFLIGALTHSGAKREGGCITLCREEWRNGECRRGLTRARPGGGYPPPPPLRLFADSDQTARQIAITVQPTI